MKNATTRAREAAMQLLFEQLFGGDADDSTLRDLIEYPDSDLAMQQIPAAEEETSSEGLRYIHEVVAGVREHSSDIDAKIAENLRGWTLRRLSRVDYAILRLAVYELLYTGLPAAIVIDEAVNLSKKYSTERSGAFVNGVLGSIHRKSLRASSSLEGSEKGQPENA